MKRIVCVLIFILLFCFQVSAEDNIYKEQYDAAKVEGLKDSLSDEAKKFFSDSGLSPEDYDWVNKIESEHIFSHIAQFLSEGGRGPLRAAAQMMGIIILFATASLFQKMAEYKTIISYIFILLTAASVFLPMLSLISAVTDAIKGAATFMTAFVPVYSGILTVGGKGLTATGMSFLLLFAAEGVNLIASFVILPLMSSYLGMGLISGIMPGGSAIALGETVKKASTWLFSLTLTVFLGLLSIQTAVNASADSAGLRTVKFVLGSLVPVTGGALSESLSTLTSSVKLLSSSVAMWAVLALGVSVLPIILELLLWRIALYLSTVALELFSIKEGANIFKCADYVLSTLLGIILFTGSLFIISLAVVTNST